MRVAAFACALLLIPALGSHAGLSADDRALARARLVTGRSAADHGDLALAESELRAAVGIYEADRLLSSVDRAQHVLALDTLAFVLSATGREDEGIRLCRQALPLSETPTAVGNTLVLLAGLLAKRGEKDEAEPLARRALKLFEKSAGPEDSGAARALNVLADVCVARGELDKADRLLRRAARASEGRESLRPAHAAVVARRGLLRLAAGRYQDAEPLLERSVELTENVYGSEHPVLFNILRSLGDCQRLRNRPGDAEPVYERSLALGEKLYGPGHRELLPSLSGLAMVCERNGDDARAESLYTRALAIADAELDPRHPDRALYLAWLAAFLGTHAAAGRAELLYLQALDVLDGAPRASRMHWTLVLEGLRSVYLSTGRRAEAERINRRLSALPPPARPDARDDPNA